MTDRAMPEAINALAKRREAGEVSFKNDDMSTALLFGQTMWCQVVWLAEYYEKVSGNLMPGDVRANCFADVANDLREIQDRAISMESLEPK